MKKIPSLLVAAAVFALSFHNRASSAAVLMHRYSFTEPSGSTVVTDSVAAALGGTNGVLVATDGSDFNSGGQLILNGTDGHVELPAGMISRLTSVTFETWVTPLSGTPDLARIFDFGGFKNIASPDPDTGRTYFFLTGDSGAPNNDIYTKITNVGGGTQGPPPTAIFLYDNINGNAGPLANGTTNFVAVVYDPSTNPAAKLYLNGVLAGTATIASPIPLSAINDTNCFLGRDIIPTAVEELGNIHAFNVSFDEFRIWSGVLSDNDILTHYNAGPDLFAPPPPPGAVTLTVTNTADGNVLVSWPVAATQSGASLYYSPTLPAASWTLAPGTANTSLDGLSSQQIVPISGTSGFFQLQK